MQNLELIPIIHLSENFIKLHNFLIKFLSINYNIIACYFILLIFTHNFYMV